MDQKDIVIRKAKASDAETMTVLLEQLGYKNTQQEVRERIEKLASSEVDVINNVC
jgi:hypothetical protein